MAYSVPAQEPVSLRAGDTWQWIRSLDDYPASLWTLKYRFKSPAGGFEIVASADGDSHKVSVAASTTATYSAGKYDFIAWVEGGSGEKYTIGTGRLTVEPDLRHGDAATPFDGRSHARRMLADIEAALEGKATKQQLDRVAIEIAGRNLQNDPGALPKLRQLYRQEVQIEEAAERLAKGLGSTTGRIQVRL